MTLETDFWRSEHRKVLANIASTHLVTVDIVRHPMILFHRCGTHLSQIFGRHLLAPSRRRRFQARGVRDDTDGERRVGGVANGQRKTARYSISNRSGGAQPFGGVVVVVIPEGRHVAEVSTDDGSRT